MASHASGRMIIDIHGHITSPELMRKFPMPPSLGDIEGMLDQKSAAGIDLTLCGSPVGDGTMLRVPGVDNYAQTVDQLRAFHDWLSETCHKHEGRLKAYVYTNPLGGPSSLAAAAETLKDDAFVGLIVNTSVAGRLLDGDDAEPFFAMAADVDVPVLLHPPAEPVGAAALEDFRLVEQVVRFNDVTLGLAAIIFAGWLERYPGLKLVAATAGGAIGLLPAKLDVAWQPRHHGPTSFQNRISVPPSELLRRVYVDTASPSRAALAAGVDAVGPSHLMFGTDTPPLGAPLEAAIGAVRSLGLSPDEEADVLGGTARRLFKLD